MDEADNQAPPAPTPSAEDKVVAEDQSTASQSTNEAPEAPQSAQEISSDVNATDKVEDERLFAGTFKTVEDMERSYQELRSKATRDAQEKAELSRILSEALMSDTPVVQAPQSQVDDYDDYTQTNNAPQNPDDAVTKKLALMEFAMGHPDADGDEMVKVLKSDPYIGQIGSYEAKLKYAYAVSRAQAQPKAVEQATRQAQLETQAKIAEKQAAQVEPVTNPAPPPEKVNEPLTAEQIRSAARDEGAFGEILKRYPGISGMMTKR